MILGIVPARAGSKRLPRKNLRLLGGRPLARWAMDAALGAQQLHQVVVSSDDAEVLALAADTPRLVPLRRPAALCSDTSPAIDYVRHAVSHVEMSQNKTVEMVVIVQPTSPFTTPADIDATVALLRSSGADSAVTVMQLDHAIHPLKLKRLEGDRLLPYLEDEGGRMAEHELPRLYVRNGSVYASRRACLDQGSLLGRDCRAVVMPRQRSIDINDALDLAFAEFLLGRAAAAGGQGHGD